MTGCQDYCGNISIPYPIGTSKECYVEEHFLVTCNDTHYDPPKLFLTMSNVEITDIYLSGNQTCAEAKNNLTSFACKANSDCYDFDNGLGYRCNCSQGYEGNPYLPNGCIDINECIISSPCNMTCQNLQGTYNCSCPEGYEGDGRKNGLGCSLIPVPSHRLPMINIALEECIKDLFVHCIQKRESCSSVDSEEFEPEALVNSRVAHHQDNSEVKTGLEEAHSGWLNLGVDSLGSVQSAKIFTSDDLKKATNNYDESKVLGQEGQGTVYKGILPDNTIVAIKKSNTQIPLIVYELVTNGTLYKHIHNIDHNRFSITWENRLRIATKTAAALSYLHSTASTPIIHRDVKSTNILLDDNYVAKVSDFGASRLIPIDQTQLTTLVQGTLGYLDTEYFHTSQLTKKSDVYSFGVVLVELLTGKKALSFNRPELERNLAMYFVSSMKEDHLFEIVDEQVMNVANAYQLKEVAILAKRCLRVKGDERPTMKEVAMELEGLRMMEKHSWVNDIKDLEETQYLLGDQLSDVYGDGQLIRTWSILVTLKLTTGQISNDPKVYDVWPS
ncbi:hypothetical protein TEA_025903 [Camellia sinensis var. sinensis]|uniref:Protein kinase domain-containing protein n=1 Tax=Camellia sinensis var. sinensis TaxID=542762 RepID=A0A4V3WKJ6_CAMSN|nr:hypothetical protein TEA_025903 [Camellia sinensis var. sinensis]